MTRCAVIPAAGRGSRLGVDAPKLLVPIADGKTIWSVLAETLGSFVDRIHVVLSPDGLPLFEAECARHPVPPPVTTSVQPRPVGMGDAIFGAAPAWRQAETIVVIWGDQVHVSPATLAASIEAHGGATRTIGLPLVALERPYVEYRFGAAGELQTILQTREGDVCAAGGLGDVGTFVLSTHGLEAAWQSYLATAPRGSATDEVNFLPFLVFLSRSGWAVRRYRVDDPNEARGINTPDDLAFFRAIYDRHGDRQAM